MSSICKKLQALKFCRCPPPSEFNDLPLQALPPYRRSPLDKLGFNFKCCWSVPLRPAAVIICFTLLVWGVLQVVTADNTAASFFTNKKSNLYHYSKIVLMCFATMLIIACGLLFVGILLSKHMLVHIFIWYTFIYNIMQLCLSFTAFGVYILRFGTTTVRQVLRLVLSMLWNCLVFYFLKIINSYKMLIWVP